MCFLALGRSLWRSLQYSAEPMRDRLGWHSIDFTAIQKLARTFDVMLEELVEVVLSKRCLRQVLRPTHLV